MAKNLNTNQILYRKKNITAQTQFGDGTTLKLSETVNLRFRNQETRQFFSASCYLDQGDCPPILRQAFLRDLKCRLDLDTDTLITGRGNFATGAFQQG